MRNNMNVLANSKNRFQGDYKRVLCVCSAGLLRSPTAAVVLSQEPYNHNTRSVGLTEEFALVPFDEVLVYWADQIVCMEQEQKHVIEARLREWGFDGEGKDVICLDIQDNFAYRDPKLVELIKERYDLRTQGKE